ncbi:patatin-like phospholipase family protein [Roseomonas marmotae]|uniref:Patatin-like phospholipase family protein n=1 Tax=Roseomonas marmotae TaxID=2768161 RepID=A0ABS3K8H6_9PROT|nr:patatin-like phospholipase family protein [Roseomonas marmotae]MBO1073307.1 patatin-like phospholipase family protein [Roseomonas marmotae]QTI79075.1 patatin-like phospholipase family protein [Roseomonas marmotae]
METETPLRRTALVLSGGIALGAFEAGLCAALEEAGQPRPDWVVGVSAGAINTVIFAGNPPERRAARLRKFWDSLSDDPLPGLSLFFGPPAAGAWRRAYNRSAALQTLLLGRPGLFTPRLTPGALVGKAPALYDLSPLCRRLPDVVDFDRLNGGDLRVTLAATDIVSGERMVFDTARGARIEPEHVAASCALLPLFKPVEIGGRLLGDGGFASNTPLDLVLDEPGGQEVLCLVAELFAAPGGPPHSLSTAVARAGDLGFGNQTQRILDGHARILRLRGAVRRLAAQLPEDRRADPETAALMAEADGPERATVARIGYRAAPDEAGPGKLFDFSRASIAERWEGGGRALREALRRLAEAGDTAPGLTLHEVEAGPAMKG